MRRINNLDSMDCGPTCLNIVAKLYGRFYEKEYLNYICSLTNKGTSLLNLSLAAEKMGFQSMGVLLKFADIFDSELLPIIAYVDNRHYIVVRKTDARYIYVTDPAKGDICYNHDNFLKLWMGANADLETENGVALLIKPSNHAGDGNKTRNI